jgi:hypothetical protein
MSAAKIVKGIGIALIAFFALIVIVGLLLPSELTIERSVRIKAPAGSIYPLISDFRSGWTRWNTFDDEDPGIRYTYEGPASGVGAVQKWTSDRMGDGVMTITRADPEKGVEFDLVIGPQPFALKGSLLMEPEGGATRLEWTDRLDLGKSPFRRLMGPLLGKMIGSSFERSLDTIRQLAEASPGTPAPEVSPDTTAAPADGTADSTPSVRDSLRR